MGEVTGIAWTDSTFNPWIGCQRVSPGCVNCYAEAQDHRWGHDRWGPDKPRPRTSVAYWKKPVDWDKRAGLAGKRHRVFCASLADVFEARNDLDVPRIELFDLIRRTPNLDWLLLTKRPANIAHALTGAIDAFVRAGDARMETVDMLQAWIDGTPPPNIWLGTTVEDQRRAEERIPHLIAVPARVRFLSCEPLLGPLNLDTWLDEDHLGFVNSPLDWVIIGGESGPHARPFHLAWARSLIWQCRNGGRSVAPAPFVKQLGAAALDEVNGIAGRFLRVHPDAAALISKRLTERAGADPAEWPEDLRVREFPEVRRG